MEAKLESYATEEEVIDVEEEEVVPKVTSI
jgi:hypothetical protein